MSSPTSADLTNYGDLRYHYEQRVERSNQDTQSWGCPELPANSAPNPCWLDIQWDPLMNTYGPSEPLSFAQWQIEEDRRFYATFPQAKTAKRYDCAQNDYPDIHNALSAAEGRPISYSQSPQSNQTSLHHPHQSNPALALSRPTTCYSYKSSPEPTNASSIPSHGVSSALVAFVGGDDGTKGSTQQRYSSPHEHETSGYLSQPSNTNTLPSVLPVQLSGTHQGHHVSSHPRHVIVSQQVHSTPQQVIVPGHEREPPLMDHLPTPTPTQSPTPNLQSFQDTSGSLNSPIGYNNGFGQRPVASGHWSNHEHGAHVPAPHYAPGHLEPNYLSSSQQVSGPERHPRRQTRPQLPHVHTSVRPPGWPTLRPPSPRIRLSPLPSKRHLEKKPPLACLFCRGRKIACGPPEPGTTEKTCNQCQRRSIKCEYPLESRRGMRTKKSAATNVNVSGPKVKMGKRSKG